LGFGYRKAACFSDATNVIDLVKSDRTVYHRYSSLILATKHLILDWNVELTHTLHEENFATNNLAKLRTSPSSRLVVLEDPLLINLTFSLHMLWM